MNTRLASHIQTELNTKDALVWLVELMERAGSSIPPSRDRDGHLAWARAGRIALEEAAAHGSKDDPQRRRTRENVLRTAKQLVSELRELLSYQTDERRLETQEDFETRANEIIRDEVKLGMCDGCGQLYRGRIMVAKSERGFCKSCIGHYAVKCDGCHKWHDPASLRPYYKDHSRRELVGARVCDDCKPEGSFICSGGCRSGYIAAPVVPGGMTHESCAARGWTLCRHCAEGVLTCRCGRHELQGRGVAGPVENQEDATNDGRGEHDVKRVKVCDVCFEAHNSARPVQWLPSVEGLNGTAFDDIRSQRRYGVEVEVCYAPRCNAIPNRIKDLWEGKGDGSLPEYGIELASVPMRGDEGLRAIRELCEYAVANNWAVTGRAGLHLHIDLSEFKVTSGGRLPNQEPLAAVAFGYLMTYRLWSCFIAPPRIKSTFCQQHNIFSRSQVPTLLQMDTVKFINKLLCGEDRGEARYKWANFQSFKRHGTLEIRSHQGTIDYEKISNWIKAHLRFTDWCIERGSREAVHRVFSQEKMGGSVRNAFLYMAQAIWKDRGMARWFRERANKMAYRGGQVLPATARQLRKAGVNPLSEVEL